MIRCTTCGSENKDNALYCFSCGGRISSFKIVSDESPIKCSSCYFVNPPDTAICGKCGKSLIPEIRNQARLDSVPDNSLVGIGGWLIVVVIGLCLSLLISGLTLTILFSAKNIGTINPDMETALNVTIALSVLLLVLNIIGLVLMISKKRVFRSFMIGMHIISLGAALIGLLAPNIGGNSSNFNYFISLCASIAWIAYFLKSERVRNTFVN